MITIEIDTTTVMTYSNASMSVTVYSVILDNCIVIRTTNKQIALAYRKALEKLYSE